MIRLIVALGNPGRSYEKTRHNIGWIFLESWAREHKATWKQQRKFNAHVAEIEHNGQKLTLLKPLTFMNLSGLAVGAFARFYKIPADEILVVHDEVAFDWGRIKLSFEGSGGGHNGVASLIQELGTPRFWRLRLGIGPKPDEFVLSDFVLGRLTGNEIKWAKDSANTSKLTLIVDNGPQKAQNDINLNSTKYGQA